MSVAEVSGVRAPRYWRYASRVSYVSGAGYAGSSASATVPTLKPSSQTLRMV